MLFKTACDDYMAFTEHERGASKATIDVYRAWLNHYQRYLDSTKSGDSLALCFNAITLRRYLYHQSERGLRPRTVRNCFAPLRGLGAYLVDHKVIADDPSRQIRLPKKDAASRDLVSDADLAMLLAACDRMSTPRRVALSRAMLSTLIFTGVRFTEFLSLRTTDIDLKARTLMVAHGKGEKSRKLYLCDELLVALSEWMRERGKIGNETDCLWAFDTIRKMGEVGTRQLIEEVATIAGLKGHPGIKPHSIRHNYATRMLRNGADMVAISASLGHAGLNTTWVYLHASETPAKAMEEYASLRDVPSLLPKPPVIPAPAKPTRAEQLSRMRRRPAGGKP